MKLFEFNTGRPYSADGQPITAVHYDGRVYFRDHARYVDASFESDGSFRDDISMRAAIMAVYDHGPAAGLRYESGSTLDRILELAQTCARV